MRGLLYYGNKDIRYSESVKEPQIKVGKELIIDVAYCGICGSDLHEYLDGPIFFDKASKGGDEISNQKLPLCLGHEFAGVVKEVGPEVTKFKVGDHVCVEATAHCHDRYRFDNPRSKTHECSACKRGLTNSCHYLNFTGLGFCDGAMSERVVASEEHTIFLPKSIPLEIGALVEPLSVAWHAVRISGLQPGDTALVLGAGPIGLATILALQGHQAGKIVASEPAAIRREQAQKLGVEVFNPFEHPSLEEGIEALKRTVGEGFQYSFDASGIRSTFVTSIDALDAGGKAVNIAIWPDKPVDFKPMKVTLEEKAYLGSMCYTATDFEQVIDAIDKGLIDVELCRHMITGKIKLEDGLEKGFKELVEHKDKHVKVLITPHDIDDPFLV